MADKIYQRPNSKDLQRKQQRNPTNNNKHYCRACEAAFEPSNFDAGEEPAHTTATVHYIATHDQHYPYMRCSRNCVLLEQHEERESGTRMYGPGYALPRVVERAASYNDLFPDEMEGV